MSGLNRGRRLAAKMRATASAFVASAPSPYTVSVPKATSRPSRSNAAARAIPAASADRSSVMTAADSGGRPSWLQSLKQRSRESSAMLEIGFAKPTLPRSGALVLLVGEGDKPSGLWAEADTATNGAIGRALAAAEFKGAKGKTCTILAPGGDLTRVVAVGLGKLSDLNARILQDVGGNAVASLSRDSGAVVAADG